MKEEMKKWSKWRVILGIAGVLGLYFATRIYKLNLLPVFVDEAIYVRWAQVMRAEPTLRFLPLSDGKQPLFMWIEMPFFKLFNDPLIAGRMVSVVAGLETLLGVSVLTYLITNSVTVALTGACLYTLVPYTLFFDKMALVDSLLSMWAIWSLIVGWVLVKKPRLDLAMILGFILGFGLLTKSPGFYFLGMQPLLFLTIWPLKKDRLIKLIGCWVVALVIALGMYNILRLGPNFNLVLSRNQDYVFSPTEVLSHPLNPLVSNMKKTFAWMATLLTYPVLVAVAISFLVKKRRLIVVTLFLWALLPLLFQGSMAKVYTTRYLLFAVPPLLVMASIFIGEGLKKYHPKAPLLYFLIIVGVTMFKIYPLYTDPHKADLPRDMKFGYMEEWTAGWGQKQVASYLATQPIDKKILVGTEGYFGTLPDGLQIYTQHLPNVNVIGVGWPITEVSERLTSALFENDVYLVVNKSRFELPISQQERLELIAEYPKPNRPDGTNEALLFFRVLK